MFKKIQNYLLINHPLLWNTKVIPFSVLLLLTNLIFFIIGYSTSSINFFESERNYLYENEMTFNFFAVLVSILSLILWLVFYFKNNSFKSFYPKTNFSLFKEWLITLLICFLLSLFITSFYYGKDAKMRSYFTESETKKRCEILSKGSFFVDGSFSNNYDSVQPAVETIAEYGLDYITFKGKKYSWNSLINKNLNSYSCLDFKTDSIHKITLKSWLVNQQKDSIKSLFKSYLSIAKEHNLESNLDENKWFDLIYDYPAFESKNIIGNNNSGDFYYQENYMDTNKFDSINKYVGTVDGIKKEFYKNYVPEKNLNYNYSKISDAWNNPTINFQTILISIYVGIALSLLVFSFRVTSGKNWLIALVGIGVLNILFGIFSAIISSQFTFPILIGILFILLLVYFLIITIQKKKKGISGITLNGTLWLLPAFIPLIYFLVLENYKRIARNEMSMDYYNHKLYPSIKMLEENGINMAYINLLFILIMMFIFSVKIKKWKGIAED